MADNTLSCQRETLHSQQLRSIKKSIDSDHGIYRDLSAGAFFPPDFPVRVRHAGFSLSELRCRVHGEGFKLGIRSLRLTFRDAAVRLLGTPSKGRLVSCPIQSGRQVQSIPLTNPCENSPRRLRLKA